MHRTIAHLTLLYLTISCPLTSASDDADYDIVYKCFYDHSWLWNKSDHCHVVAYGAGQKSFTAQESKQQVLFQDMIKQDRKDRQLVKHCFLYHQFDLNFEPCRGISWDRPTNAKYRQARLMRLWSMISKEQRRKIAWTKYFEDSDEALIQTCIYTTEWLNEPKHVCHQVAYAGGLKSHFDEHDLKLQKQYGERRFEAQVADCFFYHKRDKYTKCYDITWNIKPESFKRNALVSKLWRRLESSTRDRSQQ